MFKIPRQFIKSITKGSITIASSANNGSVVIAAFVPANSALICNGVISSNAAATAGELLATITIVNGTTIRANRYSTTAYTTYVSYTLIEFMPGLVKTNLNQGVTISANTLSGTSAVNPAVNVAKTFICSVGSNSTSAAAIAISDLSSIILTTTNLVTASRANSANTGATLYVYCQIIEFY